MHTRAAEGVEDAGAAPEAHPVLEAYPIGVHHEDAVGLGVAPGDELPVARVVVLVRAVGDAAQGAGRRTDYGQGAVQRRQVDGGRMPEILADEQREPAVPGVESPQTTAPGEVALLVEHTVGGEVHFPVDVADLAVLQIDRGVEEPVILALQHQSRHQGHITAQCLEPLHLRARQPNRHVRYHVAQEVTRQTQFGENHEVQASWSAACRTPGLVEGHVRRHVAQFRIDLRHAHSERHEGGANTFPRGEKAERCCGVTDCSLSVGLTLSEVETESFSAVFNVSPDTAPGVSHNVGDVRQLHGAALQSAVSAFTIFLVVYGSFTRCR